MTSLSLEELAVRQQLQVSIQAHRPANTVATMSGKQTEFLEWLRAKGYPGDLVTEGRFLSFLSSVKDRAPRKRGRKRKRSELEVIILIHSIITNLLYVG
jgi:hypothetical protein